MPASYMLDRTRHQVRTTVTGSISVGDILGHFEAMRREGTLGYAELIDVREVVPPFLSASDIMKAAKSVRDSLTQQRFGSRAVVVSDDLMFGLARIFTIILSDHFPIEVFRHLKEAEEWLAVESTPVGYSDYRDVDK